MAGAYRTKELGQKVGGRVVGDETVQISGVATLLTATATDLAWVRPRTSPEQLAQSQAGCFLATEAQAFGDKRPWLIVPEPQVVLTHLKAFFAKCHVPFQAEIKPSALIDPSARLGQGVSVGEYSVIGPGAIISDGVSLGNGVQIASQVSVGEHSILADRVSISPGSQIADKVQIAEGAVIGAMPFSFIKERGAWVGEVPVGAVSIGDQVVVGANTIIERGVFSDTVIGKGVKLGNLVQIAHDVMIGQHTIVVALSGIGAKTVVGDHCSIGGGALVAAEITLCDDVSLTGGAMVARTISKPGVYSSGVTVKNHQKWRKNLARFHQLETMASKLKSMESALKALNESEEL